MKTSITLGKEDIEKIVLAYIAKERNLVQRDLQFEWFGLGAEPKGATVETKDNQALGGGSWLEIPEQESN